MSSFIDYLKENTMTDSFRKIIYSILLILKKMNLRWLKGLLYFKSTDVRMGGSIIINGLANHIRIGHNNRFYDHCIFHFNKKSSFTTGDNVILSYHVLISCEYRITIGSNVQIGEFTSIRDTTHNYRAEGNMMGSEDIVKEISIGNNVWIGRGCLICEGSVIEDGVVVGAHSVVKGRLLANRVYAGSPAVLRNSRLETNGS